VLALLGVLRLEAQLADEVHLVHGEDVLPRGGVLQVDELRVEVEAVHGSADHDEDALPHLQQGHDDLVEHRQVHVGRLFTVDHFGSDTAKGV
jgi:hypothetical protein